MRPSSWVIDTDQILEESKMNLPASEDESPLMENMRLLVFFDEEKFLYFI